MQFSIFWSYDLIALVNCSCFVYVDVLLLLRYRIDTDPSDSSGPIMHVTPVDHAAELLCLLTTITNTAHVVSRRFSCATNTFKLHKNV